MSIVSVILLDLTSFACFASVAFMLAGMGTYLVKFWGKGVAQAMKENRILVASKLIAIGALLGTLFGIFLMLSVLSIVFK